MSAKEDYIPAIRWLSHFEGSIEISVETAGVGIIARSPERVGQCYCPHGERLDVGILAAIEAAWHPTDDPPYISRLAVVGDPMRAYLDLDPVAVCANVARRAGERASQEIERRVLAAISAPPPWWSQNYNEGGDDGED